MIGCWSLYVWVEIYRLLLWRLYPLTFLVGAFCLRSYWQEILWHNNPQPSPRTHSLLLWSGCSFVLVEEHKANRLCEQVRCLGWRWYLSWHNTGFHFNKTNSDRCKCGESVSYHTSVISGNVCAVKLHRPVLTYSPERWILRRKRSSSRDRFLIDKNQQKCERRMVEGHTYRERNSRKAKVGSACKKKGRKAPGELQGNRLFSNSSTCWLSWLAAIWRRAAGAGWAVSCCVQR